jgi:uncharacterized Zn finger protein (UPF0148 family)
MCDVKYCIKCEEPFGDPNHKCNKDVLESINMIEEHVKCPVCKIPVSKIEGCNNMTCAICQTNFCYRTGDIIIPGSHSKLQIELATSDISNIIEILKKEITRDYNKDIVSKIEQIFKIKDMKGISYEDIIKKLGNGYVNIGPMFEKHRVCVNKKVKCEEVIKLIGKRHEKKSLDEEFIDSKMGFLL